MNTKSNDIKISVIIPFYNRINLLFEAIDSVLNQTYKNFELILIDDGSTDDIHELLEYIKKDKRIIYRRQDHKGVSSARNLGIKIASGEYIAFLDSDDLFLPEKLERQLNYMLSGNYEVSHTSFERFCSNTGEVFDVFNNGRYSGDLFPDILQCCCIAIPTIMIKSQILKNKNEPFSSKIEIGEDVCLLIDIAYEYEILGIDEILTRIRVNENSAALNKNKQRIGLFNIISYIMSKQEYKYHVKQIGYLVNQLNDLFPKYANNTNDVWVIDKLKIADKKRKNKKYFIKNGYYPKVSIIIPVYNGSNYMRDAINSAINQTYPNIEIIVVNDGSTDNGETERIALSYGDRIRYFYKENGGVASAINYGIEKMTGDYFSWLSHDDMYTCEKIEQQIKILMNLEDKTTIVTGGYIVMDANRKFLYEVNPLKLYSEEQLSESVFSLIRGCIHGCAMLIHKSHFERVGVFNTNLPTTQDYDLFFRMLRGQKIKFHEESYVLSRSHEEQDSKKLLNKHVDECNQLWIGMMDALSDEEKCDLDGSLFLFYYNIYVFMKSTTLYNKAIEYAKGHAFDEAQKKLQNGGNIPAHEKKMIYQFISSIVGLDRTGLMQPGLAEALYIKKYKKRIVFFIGDRNVLGGLNRVLLQVAGGLCNKFDVFLISFDKMNSSGYTADHRIREVVFPHTGDPEDYHGKLINLVKLINADIFVCSHNCAVDYLNMYKRFSKIGIKTIAWNHEFYFLPYCNPQLNNCLPVRYTAFSYVNAVVWLNSFSANVYALLNSNGAIIPNPVTIDLPDINDDIKQRGKIILAISRFDDQRKGLFDLLNAYAAILKICPETELYIVGPYNLNETIPSDANKTYNELLKKLKLPEKQLHFTGWVKDVETYYRKARVHLMPSRYEGFGLVITEAAAYGIPSIIYEGSGMEDIVTDGVDGYIVPQGDIQAMASCAINLLENDELFVSISKAAMQLVKRYELPGIISKWEKLINAIIDLPKEELEDFLKKEFMHPVKNEGAFYKQIAKEYEKCISALCSRPYNSINSSAPAVNADIYIAEIAAMQKSLSWRITKPLRLVRKVLVSLKQNGIKITIRKIINRIRMRLHA